MTDTTGTLPGCCGHNPHLGTVELSRADIHATPADGGELRVHGDGHHVTTLGPVLYTPDTAASIPAAIDARLTETGWTRTGGWTVWHDGISADVQRIPGFDDPVIEHTEHGQPATVRTYQWWEVPVLGADSTTTYASGAVHHCA